ncbi:MAG: purine-nucleoside phosphorylase [Planctomycetota bacterium]|nr:MAG: purine-nucleoside phosphorylase [Planctomycetota bacterium]
MTTLKEKLEEAKSFLNKYISQPPKIGVVLGSGLGKFAQTLEDAKVIPYTEIPHFASASVEGHSGKLFLGKVGEVEVICQQGRFHYYEGYEMEKVVFPARLMAFLGVKSVILTNAAGAIHPSLVPGDLMLIQDHINFMGTNPLIGRHEEFLGPRFPDMSQAYSLRLRRLAKEVAREQKLALREGVYLALTGPSYETPAEIRMFRLWGADAVGMSTVPSVIALNQMGVEVLGISCISNMAAGIVEKPLSHSEVMEMGAKVEKDFIGLLQALIPRI